MVDPFGSRRKIRVRMEWVPSGFRVAVCPVARPAIAWSQSAADPRLIEGAKKEGQLVYYTTMTLDQNKQTVEQFEKKYPFIKVTLFRTGADRC